MLRASMKRTRPSVNDIVLPSIVRYSMSGPLGKAVEKLSGLKPRTTARSIPSKAVKTILFALAALTATCFVKITYRHIWHCIQGTSPHSSSVNLCPQAPELTPVRHRALWGSLTKTYRSEAFQSRAVEWLSRAIQVPTECYDQMDPVGEDPRWEKFSAFHDHIKKSFPLVHSTLELTKVNTYGLIFVWKGIDVTLKPLLLTAHQDVVPVEPASYADWTHPPFSGYFDGKLIWGRGAVDDKSGLIGILASMETLLENGHKPNRTVVFASGFDEEGSGEYGAQTLAPELLKMFGQNGYAMLVDEGPGYGEQYGQVIATPCIAEKGWVSVKIEVATTGGHSSMPPPHTSIGILADFLVNIENNPSSTHLTRGSPMYKNIQCLAEHAPDLPDSLRQNIIAAEYSDNALLSAQQELFRNPLIKNLVGTTQAIDLVQGGVKVNALPELAYAIVNHRISVGSSLAATLEHDAKLLGPLARQHNLSYTAFDVNMDEEVNATFRGTLTLSTAFGSGLEPAPITPTDGDTIPYRLLSGSIKAAYNAHRGISGDNNVIVSPGVLSGSTDTHFYWGLTPHIFRYSHTEGAVGGTPLPGVHTVDEAISASSFVEMIRFYTTLILNVDESLLM